MGKRAEERGAGMHMKWTKGLVFGLAVALVATGCSDGEQVGTPTATDFMKERQALASTEKPKIAPAKVADTAASEAEETDYAAGERDYFYDPRGKRDPFRSFRFADVDDGSMAKEFGPLGDYELAQLELSAVIWDAKNPRALILDPGGRAYIVREGSQIGKNSGQVIHIGDNLVLVKETYENLAGERTTKDVELRIRLSQGG